MRLKFIVCKTIQREAYLCAARSTNEVDVVLMPHGLHCEPDKLRRAVQAEVDKTLDLQDRLYDGVLLGYALCSNGIVGIQARTVPVVVARGHDCITLLLGSKEHYQAYFDSHRGVYWYSAGWIESSLQPGQERYEKTLLTYREKYGEDNARYLMEMEQGWLREYAWATYVDWGFPNSEEYRRFTRRCAEWLKWNYDELPGDPSLLQKLVDGKWNEQEFLIVSPGRKIAADLTASGIIKAEG